MKEKCKCSKPEWPGCSKLPEGFITEKEETIKMKSDSWKYILFGIGPFIIMFVLYFWIFCNG